MNLHIFHAAVDLRSYPYKGMNVLINPVDSMRNNHSRRVTEDLIRIAKPQNLMLDSGGNSIFNEEKGGRQVLSDPAGPVKVQGQLNLTPDHVLRAAEEFKPNIIIALDSPLQPMKTSADKRKEFKRKLKINISWAKEIIMSKNNICPDAHILIPIQAKTIEQFEEFLENLSGLRFTGVSIPSRNLSPALLVYFLSRLNQLGVPWVHILGTTCFSYLAVASYFARQGYFEIVSMDSCTWKSAANLGKKYMHPENLSGHRIDSNTIIPDGLKNNCRCPFCRNLSFEDIVLDTYSNRSLYLCCHNAWVTEDVARELHKNSKSLYHLAHFLKHRKNPQDHKIKKVKDALYCFENGIQNFALNSS